MQARVLVPVGALLALLTSCKTYQDVSPQLESAIQSYESARELEARLIEAEARAQLRIVESAFEGLEDAALTTLRSMLRSGWSDGDFSPDSWAAWFGTSEPIDPERIGEERVRIRGVLDDQFSWPAPKDEDPPTTRSAWDLFSKGIRPKELNLPPIGADLERVEAEYDAWTKHFEQDLLRRAPVYLKVAQGRAHAVATVTAQRGQRVERMNLVYGDLITLAKMARDQAKTLTDNAGFISMANNIARMANRFLADVTQETTEAAGNDSGSGSGGV